MAGQRCPVEHSVMTEMFCLRHPQPHGVAEPWLVRLKDCVSWFFSLS